MNYLDRMPSRKIIVNTNDKTVCIDLINNTLEINGIKETVIVKRDDSYIIQHKLMLDGNLERLCTLQEAMETLHTINAAEQAALSHTWIER